MTTTSRRVERTADAIALPEPITVVIPCYNGEHRLPRVLESLRAQSFPAAAMEILVVDDDSTDGTARVAASYGARVLRSGYRNCERTKAVGIAGATNDLILFLDDDNRLPDPHFVRRLYDAFAAHPEALGAQPARFALLAGDPPMNRYCAIFGGSDPTKFFLGKRDRLMPSERDWTLAGTIVARGDGYWVVEFRPEELPTVGAIGFLTRRSLIQQAPWEPYYFHIDNSYELVKLGYNRIVMMDAPIVHDTCETIGDLIRKKRRDFHRYLRQGDERTYKYDTPAATRIATALRMATVVEPALRAAREYAVTRDPASMLHPYVSFRLFWVYVLETIAYRLERGRHKEQQWT